jgi:hypothetical protein
MAQSAGLTPRLLAVVFVDVSRYSQLMVCDEGGDVRSSRQSSRHVSRWVGSLIAPTMGSFFRSKAGQVRSGVRYWREIPQQGLCQHWSHGPRTFEGRASL